MLLVLPALLFSDIRFSESKKQWFLQVKRSRCLSLISTEYYLKKRTLINEFFLEMFLKEKNTRNLCYDFYSQASSLYFFLKVLNLPYGHFKKLFQ